MRQHFVSIDTPGRSRTRRLALVGKGIIYSDINGGRLQELNGRQGPLDEQYIYRTALVLPKMGMRLSQGAGIWKQYPGPIRQMISLL